MSFAEKVSVRRGAKPTAAGKGRSRWKTTVLVLTGSGLKATPRIAELLQ
jgi:hypothetical protein